MRAHVWPPDNCGIFPVWRRHRDSLPPICKLVSLHQSIATCTGGRCFQVQASRDIVVSNLVAACFLTCTEMNWKLEHLPEHVVRNARPFLIGL